MKHGYKMPDGTIYAGISPDTGQPMYTTPADAPLLRTFNRASAYATQLNSENYLGHNDWRLPTKAELKVLFKHRAAIGGFNEQNSSPAGWYWSATQACHLNACGQRFSDDFQAHIGKDCAMSVRYIRVDKPKP